MRPSEDLPDGRTISFDNEVANSISNVSKAITYLSVQRRKNAQVQSKKRLRVEIA